MNKNRLIYLDCLRTLATLLVVLHHIPLLIDVAPSSHGDSFFLFFEHFGWIGVDIFFVISGFLIGDLLFREYARDNKIDVKTFILKRAFKIWPPLLAFLGASILYRHFVFKEGPEALVTLFLPYFLHIQNYTAQFSGTPFPHLWSIAVEEHFYLLLPMAIIVVRLRGRPLSVLWIILIWVIAGVFVLRCATIFIRPAVTFWGNYTQTHWRIDALAAGVLLAYYINFRQGAIAKLVAVFGYQYWPLMALIAFCPAIFIDRENVWLYTLGLSLNSVGAALLVLWAYLKSQHNEKRPPLVALIAYLGTVSYSTYLWHLPYPAIMAKKMMALWLVTGPFVAIFQSMIYICITFLLGIVMFYTVEQPALRFRNRFIVKSKN